MGRLIIDADFQDVGEPPLFGDTDGYEEEPGDLFTLNLSGHTLGLQGLVHDTVIQDFDLHSDVLRFEDVVGGTLVDLDESVDSVMDTGHDTTFYFTGGGSLTLSGITGYQDFASLSTDYTVEVIS